MPNLPHLNVDLLDTPPVAAAELGPPRPLFRELPPPPDFPMAALGKLRDGAEAIQMRTQAPPALCAQSVLAATTLAVQAQRDVELPGAGTRPLTGIFATIAASGERKTAADRIALASVYKVEQEWRDEHESARTRFANDHAAWKATRDAAMKAHKGNRSAIREALDKIGLEPKKPPPELSTNSGASSETRSQCSPCRNAQTTSPPLGMSQNDRILL